MSSDHDATSLNPETGPMNQPVKPWRIKVLRSFDDTNACARLHTGALLRAAGGLDHLSCELVTPEQGSANALALADCIAYHYDDEAAIAALRTLRASCPHAVLACFGSDIHSFDFYTELWDLIDVLIVPTALHQALLAPVLACPVRVIEEPVDPVVNVSGRFAGKPAGTARMVGWFGYPKNFYESLSPYISIIETCLAQKRIDGFRIITDTQRFPNDYGFEVIPFHRSSFSLELEKLDFVVLSHLPLNLKVNSLVKSPNKALTALAGGVIPLLSDTPSYRHFLEFLGLEDALLFRSLDDLRRKLENLDGVREMVQDRLENAIEAMTSRYSDRNYATGFVSVLNSCRDGLAANRAIAMAHGKPLTYQQFASEREKPQHRLTRFLRNRFHRT